MVVKSLLAREEHKQMSSTAGFKSTKNLINVLAEDSGEHNDRLGPNEKPRQRVVNRTVGFIKHSLCQSLSQSQPRSLSVNPLPS